MRKSLYVTAFIAFLLVLTTFGNVPANDNIYAQNEEEVLEEIVSEETTSDESIFDNYDDEENIITYDQMEEIQKSENSKSTKAASFSGGVTIKNVSVNMNNPYFYYNTYLFAGERLDFAASYAQTTGGARRCVAGASAKIYDDEGNVVTTVDVPGGYIDNSLQFVPLMPEQTTNFVADKDGIYTLRIQPNSIEAGNLCDQYAQENGLTFIAPLNVEGSANLTFKISGKDGVHIPGRVWANNVGLIQSSIRTPDGEFLYNEDYRFYHVTSNGFIYMQDFFGFNGIVSTINSDPVGVIDGAETDEDCGTVGQTFSSTPALATDTFHALRGLESCSSKVKMSNIFLEQPDTALFALDPRVDEENPYPTDPLQMVTFDDAGNVTGTRNVFAFPELDNHRPQVQFVDFIPDSYDVASGEFIFGVASFQGFFNLVVKVDHDDNPETPEIEYSYPVLANEYGPTKYYWNGLTPDGEKISPYRVINAQVEFERIGEIHFVRSDVEHEEGMRVERLNSLSMEYGKQSSTTELYSGVDYLPLDEASSPNVSFPELPVDSSLGYYLYDSNDATLRAEQGWNFVGQGVNTTPAEYTTALRLPEYYGKPAEYTPNTIKDPNTNNVSYGDGNYIDDWTYQIINYRSNDHLLRFPTPEVELTKVVDKNVASIGETVTYTIEFKNIGSMDVNDYIITDDISANVNAGLVSFVPGSITLNGSAVDDSAYVDGVLNIPTGTVSYVDGSNTAVITFDVMVESDAAGLSFLNKATATDPNFPDERAIESNEVETGVPSVSLTKEVSHGVAYPGQTVTYTLVVKNDSTYDAMNYVVVDDLSAILDSGYATFVDGSFKINGVSMFEQFNGSSLETKLDILGGEEHTITFEMLVTEVAAGQTLTNTAVVGEETLPPVVVTPPTETLVPNLGITKEVDVTEAYVGDEINYTIRVSNLATFDATNMVVTDDLSSILAENASFVDGSLLVDGVVNENATLVDNVLTVTNLNIPGETDVVITFAVKIEKAGEGMTLTNVASLIDPQFPELPPIVTPPTTTDVAKVTIVKEVSDTIASVGDGLTYTLKVTNESVFTVDGYVVYDDLSAILGTKVEFVEGSVTVDGVNVADVVLVDNALLVELGEMEAGQVVEITFEVTVLDDAAGTSIVNTASVYNPDIPGSENISDPVETRVIELEETEEVEEEIVEVEEEELTKTGNTNYVYLMFALLAILALTRKTFNRNRK